MASLAKRPGSAKPWQVRYRDHTGRSRSEQYSRKADAEARLREVQSAEETGRLDVLDAGKATLAEVGAEFFKLNRRAWSTNTAKGYAYIWNAVVEGESKYPRAALADVPVRAIRKAHVQAFVNDAQEAGVPTSSIEDALSLITRTLDHAEDEGMLIGGNPAARVKPPKAERSRALIITPAQVEAIRAQMSERDAALVSILAYAGLRPHEARALRADQIGGPALVLTESVGDEGDVRQYLKSGHDWREVPVCAALAADLAAIDWGSGYLLPNAHGEPWTKTDYANWRNRRFYVAVSKANDAGAAIPSGFTPYDLRHSIVSLWYRQGIDKATIAAQAGHSIPVLERVYAHHFHTLDPLDRRTVDEMIADARASVLAEESA
jgi:integrase